ncbi:hypothetical protein CPLU01_15378 [Colletotrichum plurivorum]|uniref:Uncharacterized protein n=1 Tax=Colletotrichum plurivorum TaxID=2175906 RepID=A0A8H6JBM6_9PEZI|nr:hypothetical protein CPLU01_15378 [Colletotrichum plurivorum]
MGPERSFHQRSVSHWLQVQRHSRCKFRKNLSRKGIAGCGGFGIKVRDLIYAQCVLINGGYVLDFDSNTLRGADGKPIDLSFRLACKRIASETRGLALSSNILNFSTVYSDNATAGRFDLLIRHLAAKLGRLISRLEPGYLIVPDGIWDDITKVHPRFAQYVEFRRNRPNRRITSIPVAKVGHPGSCGDTPSAFRNFICPWKIMSSDRVEESIDSMGSQFSKTIDYSWDFSSHTTENFPGLSGNSKKNSYSAASVAIRFLDSLSPDSRMSIRSMVLNEDQRRWFSATQRGRRQSDLCLERDILPALAWDVRRRDSRNSGGRNQWYLFEAFPQAIEDILAGRSIVKCTFELGDAWGETCDVERLIEENKSKTMDEWREAWYVREKESYNPDPPSPTWLELLCDRSLESVLPIPYEGR